MKDRVDTVSATSQEKGGVLRQQAGVVRVEQRDVARHRGRLGQKSGKVDRGAVPAENGKAALADQLALVAT